MGVIGWNYKSTLLFYKGTGEAGRLTQDDYGRFLTEWLFPQYDFDFILVEDNDNAHGTRGTRDHALRRLK